MKNEDDIWKNDYDRFNGGYEVKIMGLKGSICDFCKTRKAKWVVHGGTGKKSMHKVLCTNKDCMKRAARLDYCGCGCGG